MTTVSWRFGVLCVVVAIMWSGIPQPRTDTFPALVGPGLSLPVTKTVGLYAPAEEPQTLMAEHLPPILLRKSASPEVTRADLQRRGVITFLIPHSAASYFLYRGGQMGFEYELAQEFAQELGIELEVITPPPGAELTTWLAEGKGDIAAGFAVTDESELDPLQASVSYLDTTAQILTRRRDARVRDFAALAGQTIAVQPDAAYARSLLYSLGAEAPPPTLTLVQSEESIGGAIQMMAHNLATAALVTAPLADLAHKLYPGQLRTVLTLPRPIHMVWAVRPENTALLETVNEFLERAGRSGLRKILFEKYFVTMEHLRNRVRTQEISLLSQRLTRYDRLIARHAEEAGFDWRFIAALIFEESHFDQERVSEAGAYGLMQITPIAAQNLGIKDYARPTKNIAAGIKYLKVLTRQFPNGPLGDRLAFVLASYVMGVGHVEDARKLARTLGYDPDCWQDSMEHVLPLLEKPKYYHQTQYGAARGREALRYVNAILKRYHLYSQYVAREFPTARSRTKGTRQAASAAG
ncbi:MAG: transporter substrate-binding domain-containing protein [Deltaproteobacteria bacterium]|nr:transporter substrate-binding domain-containing protein [Deltaproteobacteria bacterium]